MRSGRIILDCGPIRKSTAATIDQIARAHLAAGRCSCKLELRDADPDLLELIRFVGLAGVLRVESGRKAKQRKQPCGVEEEGELGNPPVR
jgi:hypothetical protein